FSCFFFGSSQGKFGHIVCLIDPNQSGVLGFFKLEKKICCVQELNANVVLVLLCDFCTDLVPSLH
ncbi:MAG TPA: hypothetical protein DCF96_09635, partial [Rhodobacteraceae bacterium]|nr:hypothetical protein [Paracoccaceae bacterium]